ncbi:MAG: hypothetical protein IPH54_15395 [Rhodoferax sp.]|nr:hypothetical protein [Rhodoferax sp.]
MLIKLADAGATTVLMGPRPRRASVVLGPSTTTPACAAEPARGGRLAGARTGSLGVVRVNWPSKTRPAVLANPAPRRPQTCL